MVMRELKRGVFSLSRIAKLAGVSERTLRTALRNGERNASPQLRELYWAEVASRTRRPWGCRAGAGKPFPKPSARTVAERRAEAKMWAELWGDADFNALRGGASKETRNWEREFADLLRSPTENGPTPTVQTSQEKRESDAAPKSQEKVAVQHAAKRGRPRILTPSLIEGIAVSIRYGSSRADTARGFGLNPRTLPKWLARGKREPDTMYGTFCRTILEARRHRGKPAPLIAITAAIKPRTAQSTKLHLSDLESLRRRTCVRFAEGGWQLIELRWARPKRKLNAVQVRLLEEGLQVVALDSNGRPRSIVFLPAPPKLRVKVSRAKG
jgi:hypothetical protein